MQPVNDDMDDLYKRAAEDYPLNTDSADWNAVLKKMAAEPGKTGASKNKNYRHLLWLLLLLPLGLVYKYYFSQDDKQVHTVSKNILYKKSTDAALSKKTDPSINVVQDATQMVDENQNTTLQQLKNSSVIQRKQKGKLNTVISPNSSVTVIADNSAKANQEDKPAKKENEVVAEVQKVTAENKNETTLTPPEKKADYVLTNKKETVKNSLKKNQKQKERGLYIGLIVSPDISAIKLQAVKPGVSMGILTGYQLNKQFNVESGVSWSIKNYYSEGEHFSTNNIYLLPGAKIKNVEGECNMIEVPLTVKYNFRSSGRNVLSASAGVSSYFMKKEDYTYEVERNGQQYPYSKAYKNTSSDLFAVANFAVGYNRHLNKNITLRIEPYLKVPLKGVGIGDLPITSTGLNIGITKKISR